MIHPAFIAIAKQPGLLLEHANAYADLASAELDEWGLRCKRRALFTTAAAVFVAMGLLLGGMALLLLAVIPQEGMPMPWLLWVVPGLPLLIGAGLAVTATRLDRAPPFVELRQQVAQDLATLRILEEER